VFVKPREGALELHDKSGGAGASGGFDVQFPDHSTKTVRAGLNLGAVPPADRAALPAVVDYAWPPMIAPKQSETA